MQPWVKISILLCMFGFFKELRPSEPFITPYLIGPWKNFTIEEVSQEIYPFGTYSYLGLLVAVFLLTDILRYKSVIIFDAICGIVTWSLLVWAQGIISAQILEFFYGAFLAGEVAYYSYAYARIEDRELYARLTSYTRAAYLFGRCASGVLGQALYSTNTADLWELHIISLSFLCIASVFALLLPPVEHSIYFHQKEIKTAPVNGLSLQDDIQLAVISSQTESCNGPFKASDAEKIEKRPSIPRISISPPEYQSSNEVEEIQPPINNHVNSVDNACEPVHPLPPDKNFSSAILRAFQLLWKHAYTSFSDLWVLKWSLWWTITTAGFLQMLNYVQVLWDAIAQDIKAEGGEVILYNGAIEAVSTVLGALATLGCGWLRLNWDFVGEFTLAGIAVIEGIIVIVSSMAKELWLAYLCYVIFGVLYQAMVTIASMEVAKKIEEDSYGLIFGINTFVALVLQTIWTIVVVTDVGLALGARDQFLICGGYFIILGLFFLTIAMISTCKMGLKVFLQQPLWLPRSEVNNPAI